MRKHRPLALLAVLLCGLLPGCAASLLLSGPPPLSDKAYKELSSRRHSFIVRGSLVFDGETIAVDQIFVCDPHERVQQDRRRISLRLKTGGALHMHVPSACGLWTDVNFPEHFLAVQQRNARARPEFRPVSRLRPPDDYVPIVWWTDGSRKPTRGEAYLQELYQTRPGARLRIERLEFAPGPLPYLFTHGGRAWEEAQATKAISDRPEGEERGTWYGFDLHPLFEAEWRQVPAVADAIDALDADDRLIAIPGDLWGHKHRFRHGRGIGRTPFLSRSTYRRSLDDTFAKIPPRSHEAPGNRTQTRRRQDPLFGSIIPMDCSGDTCRARPDMAGAAFRYSRSRLAHWRSIELNGWRLPVDLPDPKRCRTDEKCAWRENIYAIAFYDPRTRVIYRAIP